MTEGNLDISYQISRQKIILIGDVSVGKTAIINAFLGQKFNDDYEPSIGVDFFSKTMRYKGKQIKLQIWDSAGQEKFKSLIPNYIRGSALIFLVYDVTNKKTFENLDNWINFVNNIESTTIVIVGNKIDLENERAVSKEEGEKFAEDKKLDFFEVSAKTDTNLQNMLFSSIASLPFFSSITDDKVSKEDIINDLEQENTEGLKSEVKDLATLGMSTKDIYYDLGNQKNTNVNQSESRAIALDLPESSFSEKKKKKCCKN